MSEESKIDFHALAKEALAETYNPRARRCWPWSHEWTMWETEPTRRYESRRCIRCGKSKRKTFAGICEHYWVTQSASHLVQEGNPTPIGMVYLQKCSRCGDVRRKDLT